MSFRRRMILLAAGAVAAAVVIASAVVYVLTRDELRGQVDANLRQKLTPGQPQAVQVRTERVSPAALRKEQARLARALAALGKNGNGSYGWVASNGHGGRVTIRGGGRLASSEVAALAKRSLEGPSSPPLAAAGAPTGSSAGRTVTHLTGGPAPGLGPLAASGLALGPNAEIFTSPKGGAGGEATVVTVALPPQNLGGATGYAQLVQPSGQVLRSDGVGPGLPVTAATRAVGAGKRKAFFSDTTVGGTRVRMLTERAPLGTGVWQVALPLGDVDSTLSRLEIVLGLVCLGGIALAAALGLLVSRAALVPVRRLTGAAESVAQTQDLGHRIEPGGADELGRLADSFNTMLAALERSRLAQRQLVSDASHELRTPLTSIGANLDALSMATSLPAGERGRVVAAARAQLDELTVLVGDLIDLSQTGLGGIELEDVRLRPRRRRRPGSRTPARTEVSLRPRRPAVPGARRAEPAGPRDRQPARQRVKMEPGLPACRPGGSACAGRLRAGERSRSRDQRGRPSSRLRPLLSCTRRSRDARLGPRPGDRAPGGRHAWRQRARRQRSARGRAAHARAAGAADDGGRVRRVVVCDFTQSRGSSSSSSSLRLLSGHRCLM
jgi:HAMP domain-containing protein